jgi:hypothetical protein
LDRDVTSAQRVRLVVALGILNLILASFAFAVGIGAPRQPEGQIAEATSAPSPALTSANESPDLGTPGPTPPPAADRAHPPCPQNVDGPPGHNKTQPGHEPCGKGGDGTHGNGKGGSDGGAIIVLPLALTAALAGGRTRVARSLRRRRLPR